MKKSMMCGVIGLLGIPVFILYVVFLSVYLTAEINTVLVLGFICGWGFAVMIPARYFEKKEKETAK